MAIPYELAVVEDLNIGHGSVTVTNPAGGTMAGNKISMGRLLSGYSLSYAASLTIDICSGDFQTITLPASVTDTTITQSSGSLRKGDILILEIVQDGTGGWTFAFPTNILGAGSYQVSTTPGDRTLITLIYNGANWMFLCAPTVSQ